MHRSLRRGLAIGVAAAGMLALAACDAGNVALWPWAEITKEQTQTAGASDATGSPDGSSAMGGGGPPPPPPPDRPINPLDPDNMPETPVIPNPQANTGAPADGTPFDEKPENVAIPISDNTPPVSAQTGQPVPPLPVAGEEPKGPNAGEPIPTIPDPATGITNPTNPATPPASGPAAPEPTVPLFKPSFYYFATSVLEPASGVGATETKMLVPDMQFPIKDAPSFAQSQVYRYGGSVKGGDQCDKRNFSAPWRDNYCETRSTTAATPWCKVTGVHLGQDIRVGTPDGCKAEKARKAADRTAYAIVAVEDGVVSNVGSYSITLRANSGGRIYRYLHLNMAKLKVKTGQSVIKGETVGYVSNDFGGTPTTMHLHFEIKLNTAENGWQYAPPYSSLLAAYQRREKNIGEKVADNFAVASAPR